MNRLALVAGAALLIGVALAGAFDGRIAAVLACGFDWLVFWTALQALAVTAGVGVAIWQLSALRHNEQVRTTLDFFKQFDDMNKALLDSGFIISPNYEASRRFNHTRFMDALGKAEPQLEQQKAIEILNCLARCSDLLQSKTIDSTLLFRHLGGAILMIYAAMDSVFSEMQAHFGAEIDDVKVLAGEAQARYRSRGGPDVYLRDLKIV